MATLEQELENTALALDIPDEQFRRVHGLLEQLKARDAPTRDHSIRVGLLGVKVAQYIPDASPNLMFYSGTLHDIGKIKVDPRSLKKTHDFGPKDMKEVKKHVMFSYEILKNIYPCSAEVVVRHHLPNGYPEELPELSIQVCQTTRAMIYSHARLLSLVDSYDAASTRKNNKHGEECNLLTPKEVRQIMISENQDQVQLIEELYDVHIFGQQD